MAVGNTKPIFSSVGAAEFAPAILTANTAKDGTGTVSTVFTADATYGSWVEDIVAQPIGTNTASVARVFINNGSTNATATNNSFIANVGLPGTTLTEVTGMVSVTIPIRRALPPGFKLNVVIGTTVAAGWTFTAFGGDYTP
jgi:hypothetical protein